MNNGSLEGHTKQRTTVVVVGGAWKAACGRRMRGFFLAVPLDICQNFQRRMMEWNMID
jgi:hypothetical protein